MVRKVSDKLFAKALEYFPGGVNSPVRAFKSVNGDPLFIERGKGSQVWDADGNQYIDFCCSWGPLILGHAHDDVLNAIKESIEKGTSFGAPNRYENTLGGLILNNNRFLEKIRFVSSGTEAVMSAVRLARGYTNRNKILKFEGCYHGHVDHLMVNAGSGLATFGQSSSAGVTPANVSDTLVAKLNDPDTVKAIFEEHGKELAAVIIEPVPANNGLLLQDGEFLSLLRDLCTAYGSMLLFDEVISGFRLGFEGAAGVFNIKPDIVTYGKIIGGGMPVGAYGASKEIMAHVAPDGAVYQAGTLSGNPVAMAAGIAQLSACLQDNFYENLAITTQEFVAGLNQYAESNGYEVRLFAVSSIFWFAFSGEKRIDRSDKIKAESMQKFRIFHEELLKRGVYLAPSGYEVGFISAAHTKDDLYKTQQAMFESLDVVFKNDSKLNFA